ncbi:mannitol dehydrogenase family protein [Leifsonella bigeumensis]|uniref:mannitol dehydrogenase family protein n=1 Tax=Leifsonella bigeumensis TaxID=433643 RepID=UPI0031D0A2DD
MLERYRNPAIRDSLARLCAGASDRIPTFLLPVVRAEPAVGGPVELSAAVVASWARYAEGIDGLGATIQIVDARRERLMSAARRQHDDPTAFIEDTELFGNLAEQESFVGP